MTTTPAPKFTSQGGIVTVREAKNGRRLYSVTYTNGKTVRTTADEVSGMIIAGLWTRAES